MNINAGTNQYNLSLKKIREEKRPSFYTIFDKLNNRKLNSKKPLNAILTQDQMYRYYLNEVEPKLAEMPDNILEDLNDESIGNLKIRDFVELLSGNLDLNKGPTPVYESLSASVSYPSSLIGLIAPSTPIPPPPPAPAAAAAVIPAPSSSVASSLAPPIPVSGLMPTGTGSIPAVAPAAAAVAPAAAAVSPSSAALTISSVPTGIATPPFSPTSVFASLTSAVSSGVSAVSSLVKPSPSTISVPPSVVASGAATVVASGVPTGTPVSGVLSPTSGAAAAGGVLPIDTGGYTDRDRISAFSRGITQGLTPPRMPVSKTKTISKDEDMIKYAIELSKYNDGLKDKKFTIKPTTAVSKMITIYERLNKRGATEDDIIKEIKKGKP